jgi:hypothetical protein
MVSKPVLALLVRSGVFSDNLIEVPCVTLHFPKVWIGALSKAKLHETISRVQRSGRSLDLIPPTELPRVCSSGPNADLTRRCLQKNRMGQRDQSKARLQCLLKLENKVGVPQSFRCEEVQL